MCFGGRGALSSQDAAAAFTNVSVALCCFLRYQEEEPEEYSIDSILKELAEIQRQGPKKYCILGTRHCSFLHQQIIELLAYALVLSGNHVFTSGAMGTNAAAIRGALRGNRPELLTVVLPQSYAKQTQESQDLLQKVRATARESAWCHVSAVFFQPCAH